MDWITMSLEARNLAYNNVEHVGPENARKKTEEWAAASQTLRQQRREHLDLAYGNGERNKWDLYPANDPKAPCFVHIHGGYWQRGSKEIFACLSEGPLARGWSTALCGYTLAPEATLTQITNEMKSAFDWLNAKASEHGIQGPIIVTGWSAGGHLTSFILDHPKVAAGLAISGVFDLGARLPACQRQGEAERGGNPEPLAYAAADRQQTAGTRLRHRRVAGHDREQPRLPCLPVARACPGRLDTDRQHQSLHDSG
jgi:acetyl esterase/lipase